MADTRSQITKQTPSFPCSSVGMQPVTFYVTERRAFLDEFPRRLWELAQLKGYHHEDHEDNEGKGISSFTFKSFMRFMVKPSSSFPCYKPWELAGFGGGNQ